MGRTPRLALLALTLFLVSAPLVLPRPGVPSGLKADEPAYFAMALSLVEDGDLRAEPHDLRRIVEAFPFGPTRNLILMSDDGWHTVHFGKPYVYSLFAAPAAALAGAGGMIAFNMALLMGMVWLGALYLAQYNRGGLAALFSAGFFLVSAGFAYAFWIHPEIFNMAGVAASLFLVVYRFTPPPPTGATPWARRWARVRKSLWNETTRPALSGAALGLAVYNKPMLLALALPAIYLYGWRRRRLLPLAAWCAGLALCLAATAGIAWALTGHPTAYMGSARGSFEVCDPDVMPVTPIEVPAQAQRPKAASWSWILGLPDLRWRELLENLTYFLVGRHTGLLLYFPFAALATLLFLAHGRRSGVRWAVAAAVAAVAAFFLLWIPFNWHGGGGFIGNRYFVNAYPAFLFLVTRIAPAWTPLAGFLAGGLFLGSVIFTPLGRSGPSPTLQFHVRSAVFRPFPLELSLRQLPGYQAVNLGPVQIRGRDDQIQPRGDSLWLRGADTNELWLVSLERLERPLFLVTSFATENRIELELGGDREVIEVGPGGGATPSTELRLVELDPDGPDRIRWRDGTPRYVYRLVARVARGEVRQFEFRAPPERCTYFAYTPVWEDSFFAGAQVTFLGTRESVERDLYAFEWRTVRTPWRTAAGGTFNVVSRIANTSAATWPAAGGARVNLSYHWLGTDGEPVVTGGERTHLAKDLAPGEEALIRQAVEAPEQPGTYTLVLEPVYENVAWFSDRMGEAARHRARVRVVPPDRMPQAGSTDAADPNGAEQ